MSVSKPHTRPGASQTAGARTLWEQGRRPGRGVAILSTTAALALAGLDLSLTDEGVVIRSDFAGVENISSGTARRDVADRVKRMV